MKYLFKICVNLLTLFEIFYSILTQYEGDINFTQNKYKKSKKILVFNKKEY